MMTDRLSFGDRKGGDRSSNLSPSHLELRKQVGSDNSPEAKQDFQNFRHKLLAILTRFG